MFIELKKKNKTYCGVYLTQGSQTWLIIRITVGADGGRLVRKRFYWALVSSFLWEWQSQWPRPILPENEFCPLPVQGFLHVAMPFSRIGKAASIANRQVPPRGSNS